MLLITLLVVSLDKEASLPTKYTFRARRLVFLSLCSFLSSLLRVLVLYYLLLLLILSFLFLFYSFTFPSFYLFNQLHTFPFSYFLSSSFLLACPFSLGPFPFFRTFYNSNLVSSPLSHLPISLTGTTHFFSHFLLFSALICSFFLSVSPFSFHPSRPFLWFLFFFFIFI